MNPVFVYGTLCHEPLLRVVVGEGFENLVRRPARLPDHATYLVRNEIFPVIVASPGAEAEGLLIEGLNPGQLARLDHYENGYDYTLMEKLVETASGPRPADVYFPPQGRWQPGASWSLAGWARAHGDLVTRAAHEVMAGLGRVPPQVAATHYHMALSRAQARIAAEAEGPASARRIELLSERDLHTGHYVLRHFQLCHEGFDGVMVGPAEREVLVSGDAAIVLPYDPRRDRILLIEQFRAGPFARGAGDPWLLEPVAGMVDGGESPELAARRELQEEAGITARAIERIAGFYPTPGGSSEFFHLFLALCDLPDALDGSAGGLASEQEDIRCRLLSHAAAQEMLAEDRALNAPLVVSLLWLARERERLRASA